MVPFGELSKHDREVTTMLLTRGTADHPIINHQHSFSPQAISESVVSDPLKCGHGIAISHQQPIVRERA